MNFFDCNTAYGLDFAGNQFLPVPDIQTLSGQIKRAGIEKAVVWRLEQHFGTLQHANAALAQDLRGRDEFYGLWAILPPLTHEGPGPDEMAAQMKANRIIGWRIFPQRHRFLPRAMILRDWLKLAVQHRIPLFVNTAHGTRMEDLLDIMQSFPELLLVLTYASDWPSDRQFRPFLKEFPNLYLDLTFNITDGGTESLVEECSSSRLLFGSGFPSCYFGGNMLMIRHAELPLADRQAIAAGNLQRIIREVRLD